MDSLIVPEFRSLFVQIMMVGSFLLGVFLTLLFTGRKKEEDPFRKTILKFIFLIVGGGFLIYLGNLFFWQICVFILVVAGIYLTYFLIVVGPIVLYRWATGQSPRYIPKPWPTKEISPVCESDLPPPP